MAVNSSRPSFSFSRLIMRALALTVLVAQMGAVPEDAQRSEMDPTKGEILPPVPIAWATHPFQFMQMYGILTKEADSWPGADKMPATGARINAITAGSPAAVAGLRPYDIIVAIDGQPVTDALSAQALRRAAKADQKLEIFSPGNYQRLTVSLPLGKTGMQMEDGWLLEGQYLHSLPAGVAPINSVRIAARFADTEPTLAEDALAYVQKTGSPGTNGPEVDAIAAEALFNDCWFEDALAYATSASKGLPEEARPQLNRIIFNSAVATFRYQLAEQTADNDSRFGPGIAALHAQIELARSQHHTAEDPNPAASNINWDDQTRKLVNLAPHSNHEFECSAGKIRDIITRGGFGFATRDGSYDVCRCGPGNTNVCFSSDCIFKASDNGHSGYVKVMRVGVVDENTGVRKMIELYPSGLAEITGDPGTPEALLNLQALTVGHYFQLKMTIVGDSYEFTINGRRIFYGPMPAADSRNLTLLIQTVGLTGGFGNTHWCTAVAN